MNIIDFLAWIRLRLAGLGPTDPEGAGTETAPKPGAEAEGDDPEGEEPAGDEPEGAAGDEPAEGGADPDPAEGEGEGGASAEENAESTAEGSDAGATEADEGAGVAATTIRSAVEAKLAALKAQGLGTVQRPGFKFKPEGKVTDATLAEYQRLVDADKQGEAMVLLMREVITQDLEQAFTAYHTNIVHPLSTLAAQAARDSRIDKRATQWEKAHPNEKNDVELKAAMIAEYNKIADKHGVLLADEVSLDELMLMAKGSLPRRKGKTNGKADTTEGGEDDKSKRLAARAPGAVARLRTGSGTGKGGAGAPAKDSYLEHLKSHRTDPFR